MQQISVSNIDPQLLSSYISFRALYLYTQPANGSTPSSPSQHLLTLRPTLGLVPRKPSSLHILSILKAPNLTLTPSSSIIPSDSAILIIKPSQPAKSPAPIAEVSQCMQSTSPVVKHSQLT